MIKMRSETLGKGKLERKGLGRGKFFHDNRVYSEQEIFEAFKELEGAASDCMDRQDPYFDDVQRKLKKQGDDYAWKFCEYMENERGAILKLGKKRAGLGGLLEHYRNADLSADGIRKMVGRVKKLTQKYNSKYV